MTDDERQKLINSLKTYQGYDRELNKLVHDAADEIERLEKENKELYRLLEVQEALAQSDAEPEHHPDGRRKGRSRLVYDKEQRTIVPESSQSHAEPVAWRWRYNEPPPGPWALIDDRFAAERLASRADIDVEPLAPPRPDASAGLIKAAEWHEEQARTYGARPGCADTFHFESARALRARAAERSAK